MQLPTRKLNRLSEFDYSSEGAYFITICTKDRKCLLGNIVGEDIIRPKTIELSKYGKIADESIKSIPMYYDGVFVDKYTIMPNHIHMIIRLTNSGRIVIHRCRPLCHFVTSPHTVGSHRPYGCRQF